MKRIILCEGKTDAILISYFLNKRFGWEYIKEKEKLEKLKKLPGLPVVRANEKRNWYRHPEKPDQELAIWGVGGIDQLPIKLGQVIERTRIEGIPDNRFESIVLFFDRNSRSKDECENLFKEWIVGGGIELSGDLQIGQWVNASITLNKTPKEDYQLHVLSIALPPDSEGNLEVFLMNSLKEQSCHDRQLVDEADKFISCLPDEPYLSKKRLRPKACLGSILSVMSPDWVFSEQDKRLRRVQWERIESLTPAYEKLSEL